MGRAFRIALLCSAGFSTIASPVFAQDASEQQSEVGEQTDQNSNVIIVTAQGRSQQLEEVPIAIAAFAGESLEQKAILDVETFVPQLPGVTLAESPFQRSISIRGVGSTGGNFGYEQSAPFFIDGIFGGRGGQFLVPFFDLDRVEVIRGPQAIFFGKNATAGAISINSARPTSDFYARFSGGYEFIDGGVNGEAVVSGALTDSIRARLAIRYSERGDYLFDTSTNEEVGGDKLFAIRGSVEVDLADNLEMYIKGEFADRKEDRRNQLVCLGGVTTVSDPFGNTVECVDDLRLSSGALAGPFAAPFPAGSDFGENDSQNVAVHLNWGLGDHNIQFISGYSAYSSTSQDGLDRSSLSLASSSTKDDFEQWSQEVRLVSPEGKTIEYVLGALYLKQDHINLTAVNQFLGPAGPMFGAPAGLPVIGDVVQTQQDAEAFSAFAQLTWNITDELSLAAGGRFTTETKHYSTDIFRYVGAAGVSVTASNFDTGAAFRTAGLSDLTRSEDVFDPSITLTWIPSSDATFYATYAQGTKAGGFEFFSRNLGLVLARPNLEYDEEEATSYEIGWKTSLFDRLLSFNGAIFHAQYDGLQNQILNTAIIGFETFNFDGEVSGVELDALVRLPAGLEIGGAVSYLDATFNEGSVNPFNPAQDFSGNPLPFAAEWSGNAFVRGNFDVATDLSINALAQVNYTGEYGFDAAFNAAENAPATTMLDLRLGLASNDGWEVAVFGRNVTDEEVRMYGAPTALTATFPGAPRGVARGQGRTVTVQFRFEF